MYLYLVLLGLLFAFWSAYNIVRQTVRPWEDSSRFRSFRVVKYQFFATFHPLTDTTRIRIPTSSLNPVMLFFFNIASFLDNVNPVLMLIILPPDRIWLRTPSLLNLTDFILTSAGCCKSYFVSSSLSMRGLHAAPFYKKAFYYKHIMFIHMIIFSSVASCCALFVILFMGIFWSVFVILFLTKCYS